MASTKKSTKKYNNMQKSVIRNPEVNLRHTKTQVVHEDKQLTQAYLQNKQKQQGQALLAREEDTKNGLCLPQKNSSERAAREIERLETQARQLQINVEDNPQTQELIANKITKILNFRPDQVVFKNLISLNVNVNDSVLLPKSKSHLGKKYERSDKNRIPVPDLADFLDPLPPLVVPVAGCCWQPEHISPHYDCFDTYTNYYGTQHPLF